MSEQMEVEVEPLREDYVEAEYNEWMRKRCFKQYLDKSGELKRGPWDVKRTADVVRDVIAVNGGAHSGFHPCVGRGVDGRLWIFEAGVWVPGERQIHEALVWLLGDQFNLNKRNVTVSFLMGSADLPIIDGTPASAWINFKNGLLHWETGEFYGHNQAHLTTVQLGCNWNAEATCEPWLDFLSEVIPEDAIDTFQEIVGYLMYSGEPLHKAFMFNGSGRNGKGVTLGVIEALLGGGNVAHISLQSLGTNRFAAAGLLGCLANIVGDMSATYVKETDTFKSATGGDTIYGEHKGKDFFSFKPFASHVFSTNKLPTFADTSVGFIDRWVVIPFPYTVPAEKRDPNMKDRLCEPAVLEGIAVWGLAGLQRLMARGRFDLPPSMKVAHEEFAISVHPVRAFLKECVERSTGSYVRCSDMYKLYVAWLSEQGRSGLTKIQFKQELEMLGVQIGLLDGYDIYRDVATTKTFIDFVPAW